MNVSRMAAIVLAGLLLAYPLSIGPVFRWQLGRNYKDFKQLSPALLAFYAPMRFVSQNQFMHDAFMAYTMLWLSKETKDEYGLR